MSRAPASPCKDCPDRTVGCHGECEKYKAYKRANEAHKQEQRGLRAGSKDADGYGIARHACMKKRRES